MWIDLRITLFVAAVALPANVLTAYAVSGVASDNLASVESFSSISDPAARSAAYFTELGKLLTGQDYGGDAKKCMDAVAAMIDAKTKDAGLL